MDINPNSPTTTQCWQYSTCQKPEKAIKILKKALGIDVDLTMPAICCFSTTIVKQKLDRLESPIRI